MNARPIPPNRNSRFPLTLLRYPVNRRKKKPCSAVRRFFDETDFEIGARFAFVSFYSQFFS